MWHSFWEYLSNLKANVEEFSEGDHYIYKSSTYQSSHMSAVQIRKTKLKQGDYVEKFYSSYRT